MKNILLLITALTSLVFSQSLLATRYLGGLSYYKTGPASRMSGFGIGSNDVYNIGAYNPGNLGNVDQSVYTLKFTLDYTRLIDEATNSKSDFVAMVPDFVGFAFPFGKAGVFGLSFSKDYGNKYTYISGEDEALATDGSDTLYGWTGYYRKSAISSWEVLWGYNVAKFFKPGITYRRYYFTQDENSVVKLNGLGGTGDSTHLYQGGNSFRAGISGTIGKVTYGISGEYNFEDTINSTRLVIDIKESSYSNGFVSTLVNKNAQIEKKYTLQLPPKGGAGIQYQIDDRMKVGVDFSMVFWEQATTNAPKSIYYDKYQNTMSGNIGFSFVPAPKLLAPKYYERILYSAGFRASTLPIEGDKEISGSIGLGLPLGKAGILDLAFEGGQRSSIDVSRYKENFFKFSITTSGGRKWRKKNNTVY